MIEGQVHRRRSANRLIVLAAGAACLLCTPARADKPMVDVQVGAVRAEKTEPPAETQAETHPIPLLESREKRTANPIVRPATQPIAERTGAGTIARAASFPGFDLAKLLYSFAIVLGVIFALRFVAKRFLNLPGGAGAPGPVQVLHRTPLGPKQHLMLIQAGNRVVLVANCGAQMNTLTEFKDPDEVAALLSQTRPPANVAPNPFATWFGKAKAQFNATPDAGADAGVAAFDMNATDAAKEPAVESTREEVGELLEKVRELSRTYKRA